MPYLNLPPTPRLVGPGSRFASSVTSVPFGARILSLNLHCVILTVSSERQINIELADELSLSHRAD